MNDEKSYMFLLRNGNYFNKEHIPLVRERLNYLDEHAWNHLGLVEFRNPVSVLIISLLAGPLGIDRFLIGHTGLGIAKLLTCGGLGFWAIFDFFLIMDAVRAKNWVTFNECMVLHA